MATIESIQRDYPLHWLVWNNDCNGLRQQLSTNQVNLVILPFSGVNYSWAMNWKVLDSDNWC